jgi:hypothetical protein
MVVEVRRNEAPGSMTMGDLIVVTVTEPVEGASLEHNPWRARRRSTIA